MIRQTQAMLFLYVESATSLTITRKMIAILLWLSLSIVCFSAIAQDESTETAPESAVEVTNTRADDHAIEQRLQEIFDNLDGLGSIQISVDAGVVTLNGEVPSVQASEQAVRTARRVEGVVELNNELQETRDVRRRLLPTVAKLQGYSYDFVSYLPLLVLALGVVIAFALLARFIASQEFLFKRLAPNPFLLDLLQQFIKVAVFLVGVLLALDLLDATRAVGTVLGAAGLISLAVSFALRDSVENYITSILLSLRQPFAPDDHVLIEGFEGRIARLTSRATILLTFDGDTVRIPNATVFKATIVNYSRNPLRRFNFIVGVAPDAALLEAQQLALDTLRGMDGVLDEPQPLCLVDGLGNYSVDLFVAGWIDQNQADFLKVKSEAIRLITQAFAAADIDIPDPTYNVRLQRKPSATEAKPAVTKQPGKVAIDISRDDSLEQQVAEDRQHARSSNLLDSAAPKE